MKYTDYLIWNENELRVNPNFHQIGEENEEEFMAAVKNNDPSALFILGNSFDAKHNYEVAVHFYHDAAIRSYAPAEHYLALCYFNGDGVEEDEDLCKYWMSLAANHGDATAAEFMGRRYDENLNFGNEFLNQNDRLATFWYLLGAKMGNGLSMNNLSLNYQSGIGLDKNEIFARYWLCKSADAGYKDAVMWARKNPDLKWNSEKIKKFEKSVFKHRITNFGHYFINDRQSKQPIQWIVCAESDDLMILVSKCSLAVMRYAQSENANWATSEIRNFLNGDFLHEAFEDDETQALIPQHSQNELNPVYETESGEGIRDLVSIPDTFDLALRLNFDEWGCKNTEAASLINCIGQKFDSWWLRNKGEPGNRHHIYDGLEESGAFFSYVDNEGKINYKGLGGQKYELGIRPLIIVDKKKYKELMSCRELKKQQALRREQGLCQYCGGSFNGLFNKKCSKCGKKKDY